ncbi:hypothetical protein C2S53_004803 [Perilla frutescens var. hirtella]|uniref:Uncharacterized protein n=1 Tax=Perilla frutescens var. hirtella TaxID=608512 RepID=A0AAD4JHS4_PERFH|nr:hypothetical protein C2S53_004803 [Perilla frutescens var. hirtella]
MENFLILFSIVSIATLAFITRILKDRRPKQDLPPGPKPWPIIGNLNLLGSIPHQSLHHLSQKYGEIMLLKFGKFPVVIASSPEMARQFLKVHDAVFASRPALAAGKYTAYNYSDMTWAPYGPYWRQARKIFFSEVFNAKRLEFYERIRVEERRNFLSRLGSLSGEPVGLRDHLYCYTQSTICRMIIGDKYMSKSDELQEMVDEWFLLNGVFNIGDWIPWLSFFDLQGYVKKMKALHKKLDSFHNFVIEDHLAGRAAENDVVHALLQMVDDPNLGVQLTRDCVKALIQDLLVGGTDTSATIVEWAVHEILRQPRIVEKAKEELDRVIGRKRWVEENDFPSHLPYIDAIVMETCRLHPVGTLLGPHYATQDCNVAGYNISKGTTVLINAWSIGRDPDSWAEPEAFLPERFVGKETDMLGSNFGLLPFGSGRRRCPGHNLGLKLVRTTLANLLHGFELKLVEDVSMEEEYGLTTHPKHPLNIIMKPTLPPYLYS